ncbi:hypothetical protein KKE60_04390 [Patescibacteria group bacterium]|nr:hypothetical protein [Patescibacteria group bacterium]
MAKVKDGFVDTLQYLWLIFPEERVRIALVVLPVLLGNMLTQVYIWILKLQGKEHRNPLYEEFK